MHFGEVFAIIGRNPRCGCPLAIDMDASAESQQDFLERGLLIEILPETVADQIWQNSTWPCPHSQRFCPMTSEVEAGREMRVDFTLHLLGKDGEDQRSSMTKKGDNLTNSLNSRDPVMLS